MTYRLAYAVAALMAATAPAVAQEASTAPVVVELFTSQGCTACPPADALLGELAERDDVIALALHVDYWDYIGWADIFADPAYTERQHGYGHRAGSTVVYTPQMIVGGQDHVVGYRPMDVADLIQAHAAQPYPVAVSLRQDGQAIAVSAEAEMPPPRPEMVVQVVSYLPHETVEITRGERAGTIADHYNIVTSWQVVAQWNGGRPFQAQITRQDANPLVVIVQEEGHGRILGAAKID